MNWIRYEKELIPPIVSVVPTLVAGTNPVCFALEHTVDYRTVDVVVSVLPSTWNDAKDDTLLARLRPLAIRDLMVLEHIRANHKVSNAKLARDLHLNVTDLAEIILPRLERLRLVHKSKRSFCPTGWVKFYPLEIMTIEAKLSRWKEAIEQARFNSRFSDKSYIAIPSDLLARCETIHSVSKQVNVGLITVDANQEARVATDPMFTGCQNMYKGLQKLRVLRDIVVNREKWSMSVP